MTSRKLKKLCTKASVIGWRHESYKSRKSCAITLQLNFGAERIRNKSKISNCTPKVTAFIFFPGKTYQKMLTAPKHSLHYTGVSLLLQLQTGLCFRPCFQDMWLTFYRASRRPSYRDLEVCFANFFRKIIEPIFKLQYMELAFYLNRDLW